jgi:RimJ/RimL family protein N-acetyltransferase
MDVSFVDFLTGIRTNWANYEYFFDFGPVTRESELAWIGTAAEDRSQANFVILSAEQPGCAPLGTISLTSIDMHSRHAEYGRLYVDPAQRRGGVAVRASRLLVEYAFLELNLRRIYLRVLADNHNAIELYKRLGFAEEGRLVQHVYKNGDYRDVLLMGLFARPEEASRVR